MSRIGNHVVEMQESDDYRFGWENAERGEPKPIWACRDLSDMDRLQAQQLGWHEWHENEQCTDCHGTGYNDCTERPCTCVDRVREGSSS